MKCSTNGITKKGTFTRGNTKKGIKEIILAVGGKCIVTNTVAYLKNITHLPRNS